MFSDKILFRLSEEDFVDDGAVVVDDDEFSVDDGKVVFMIYYDTVRCFDTKICPEKTVSCAHLSCYFLFNFGVKRERERDSKI